MTTWKFITQYTNRQVGYRYTETAMPDGAMRFTGTPAEALNVAQSIGREGGHNWIAAVCEDELTDDPGWTLFRVVERRDKSGWNLEANVLTGNLWFRERESAVSYAVSRSKGHVAAVRVIEKGGKLRSLLLVDQREERTSKGHTGGLGLSY
jgi:hypothetical protein